MKFALIILVVLVAGCEPMSAIHEAAESGDPRRVDALLARGADINLSSPVHGSALTIAARRSDMPMIQHLLDKGADVNGGSPLSLAAWYGNEDLARLLIARGAAPNRGSPALPRVSRRSRPRTAECRLPLTPRPKMDATGGSIDWSPSTPASEQLRSVPSSRTAR